MTSDLHPQKLATSAVSLAIAIAISLIPFGALRRLALNSRRGFEVHPSARVGWASPVQASSFAVGPNCSIGIGCIFRRCGVVMIGKSSKVAHRNGFYSVASIEIGDFCEIGYANRFQGAEWLPDWSDTATNGELRFGRSCLVTAFHFFDTSGGIDIGNGTTIGGRRSEFWTHGVSMKRNSPVRVGESCYVGSGVKFAAGVAVPDHSLVALGSVVMTSVDEPHAVIAGNPAAVVRVDQRHGWQSND